MKKLLFISLLFTSFSTFSNETCFEVSAVKGRWSRTPELICINQNTEDKSFDLTLKTGNPPSSQKTVATFNLNLLNRVRCLDCNQDLFGMANPTSSAFNKLSIQFNGLRDVSTMKEAGILFIGKNKFYYRSLR